MGHSPEDESSGSCKPSSPVRMPNIVNLAPRFITQLQAALLTCHYRFCCGTPCRRNSLPGKSHARPHAETAERDTASSGYMPANPHNLGSDIVDTATASADPLGPGGDHRVTRKRAAEHLQDAAALLQEGSPSTDTSDLSGSRSDGGSGSRSDGGSNEGSNDVGTTPTVELDSPLASLPHAVHVNSQHLTHTQPASVPFSAPAAAPMAAATACLIEQPSAKRTKLLADHARQQIGQTAPTAAVWSNTMPMAAGPPPLYSTVPLKAITAGTERSIRRSLDMAAGSDSQAPSSLAGIQSGAGSNQEGCETPEQKLVGHKVCHFSAADRTGASHGSGTQPGLCGDILLDVDRAAGSLEATAPTQMSHQCTTANNGGLACQPPLAVGLLKSEQQQQQLPALGDTRVQLPHEQLQQQPNQAVQDMFCMDTGTSAWCAAAFDAPAGFLC